MNREEFQKKLAGLGKLAAEKGNRLTGAEVKEFLGERFGLNPKNIKVR